MLNFINHSISAFVSDLYALNYILSQWNAVKFSRLSDAKLFDFMRSGRSTNMKLTRCYGPNSASLQPQHTSLEKGEVRNTWKRSALIYVNVYLSTRFNYWISWKNTNPLIAAKNDKLQESYKVHSFPPNLTEGSN